MRIEVKDNINYCAKVVKIDNLIPLEEFNNLQGTYIFGNHVLISKNVNLNDVGLYFPVGTQLSEIFVKSNNLYKDKSLNNDINISGSFNNNRKVKAVHFKGVKSDGFFIPLKSLNFILKNYKDLKINDTFDHINNIKICEKYINKINIISNIENKNKKYLKKFNKLIEDQFKFHIDTQYLGYNIDKIQPNDLISITKKIHGCSYITSYLLCKKELNWYEKILKKLKVNIKDSKYDYIYSSRKDIKNQYYIETIKHYYNEDIWGEVHKELKPYLIKGMTIYGECAGYLQNGNYIQKNFDYSCNLREHKNFIYRITLTNEDGITYEWSMFQIQEWCKLNNLNVVPILYYGTVKELFNNLSIKYNNVTIDYSPDLFLKLLSKEYLEKKCDICKNNVPDEGIVLRKESLNIESYKLKSFLFKELESNEKNLDEINLEDFN